MNQSERFTVLDGGPSIEERGERLVEGADDVVADRGRPPIVSGEHFLLIVSGALMALGLAVILIGWSGAANATLVEEQVPYLISGGVFGLALALIGALTFFSHWLATSIRESRRQESARQQDRIVQQQRHEELMAALAAIAGSLANEEEPPNGRARSTRAQRPLRRSPGGS